MSQGCCTGYGLLEVIISLVILSTTILLTAGFGLQQIQQSRQGLIVNQWRMQVDSLAILLWQNPQLQAEIIDHWQTDFQNRFPQATLQFTRSKTHIDFTIRLIPYGTISNKTLTRTDAG